MARGIIVFGASGSGTTTLGKELARLLGFRHFDLDDYYWRWDTELPFTVARPRAERIGKLLGDMERCPHFVLSGSLGTWSEPFIPLLDLAVFATAPAAVRVERLHARELSRYGDRIRAGGDMHSEHKGFLDWAEQYDTMEPPERCLKLHEKWIESLICPVLRVDGTIAIEENAEIIMNQYSPKLPSGLEALLRGYSGVKNRISFTTAAVYRYQGADRALYLKIALADHEIRREQSILLWLKGKLPVPEVKYWSERDGLAYLLLTEALGRMACDCPEDAVVKPIENTVKLLAEGLLMLQAVDISDCPFDNMLDRKLAMAFNNIENDLVNMDIWEDDSDFKLEFDTPKKLYNWLAENRPQEDICFTHGDYCLPNVFIGGANVTGFIDIGRGGVADRWQDIALCVRSLRYNLGDMEKSDKDKYVDLLFFYLGIEPDLVKIRYYTLLDELF